jgi:hypothetical protein
LIIKRFYTRLCHGIIHEALDKRKEQPVMLLVSHQPLNLTPLSPLDDNCDAGL